MGDDSRVGVLDFQHILVAVGGMVVSTIMSITVMGSVVMDAFVISITMGIVSVEVARFSVRSHRDASPISNPQRLGATPNRAGISSQKNGEITVYHRPQRNSSSNCAPSHRLRVPAPASAH